MSKCRKQKADPRLKLFGDRGQKTRGRRVGEQGIRRSGDSAVRCPVEKSGEQGIRKLGDRPAMHSMPYGKYAKSAKFFRQDNPPLRKASAVAKAMADKTADLRRMDRIISWLCVLGLAVLKMQASATDQPSPAGQAHGLKCSAPY